MLYYRMMSKRVVILISHWTEGGAQQAALRLTRGLIKRGHDAELWALYQRRATDTKDTPVHLVHTAGEPGPGGYLSLLSKTAAALRRHGPDAVISFLPLASIVGQAAARWAGIQRRIASHRVRADTYHPLMRWGDWLCGNLGFYTDTIAVSEAVRQSVPGFPAGYRRRMRVVHNGLDSHPSARSKADARSQFKLPEHAKLLLAVGRLATQKNYSLLLDAVAPCPDLHLVIAGDGPLRPALEGQAKSLGLDKRLHLLGHVHSDRMPDLYRACDAFALASLFEGQSNALLEALREGMVIFASDIPEQTETLVDEHGVAAGILLPVDDAKAWTDAFKTVLGDEVKEAAYRAKAKQRAKAFSLDAMLNGFEAGFAD